MSKAIKIKLGEVYAVRLAVEPNPYHYTEPTVEAVAATKGVVIHATTNPDFSGTAEEMPTYDTISQGDVKAMDAARAWAFIAITSEDEEAEVYVSGFKLGTKHYAVDSVEIANAGEGYADNDEVVIAGDEGDKLARVALIAEEAEVETVKVESATAELGEVTVNKNTFISKVSETGTYTFESVLVPGVLTALIGEAPEEGEPDTRVEKSYHYLPGGGEYPDVLESWVNVEDETDIIYTPIRHPHTGDAVYSEPDVEAGEVKEYVEDEIVWVLESEEVVLAEYGIEFDGTAADGDEIEISYTKPEGSAIFSRLVYAGLYAEDPAGTVEPTGGCGTGLTLTVTSKVIFA